MPAFAFDRLDVGCVTAILRSGTYITGVRVESEYCRYKEIS